MSCRTTLLVVAALAGAGPISAGQSQVPPWMTPRGERDSKGVTETAHLTMTASAEPQTAAPGSSLTLAVDVTPKPKMHVYAPEQRGYIPIQLTLTGSDAYRAARARYPSAEKFRFEPLNETQRVYSKPFRIVQPITIAKTLPEGSLTIRGTVRYQACDDAICYLPQALPVAWTITVKR